jgi:ferredoxin-NADP reductase
MAVQAAKEKLPHEIHLFYSNRTPQTAAFLDVLQRLQGENPHFHLIANMTGMDESLEKWSGETGQLDAEKLRRHIQSLNGPIYYIAGPPGMVAGMRDIALKAGVDEDDIRTEDFPGY